MANFSLYKFWKSFVFFTVFGLKRGQGKWHLATKSFMFLESVNKNKPGPYTSKCPLYSFLCQQLHHIFIELSCTKTKFSWSLPFSLTKSCFLNPLISFISLVVMLTGDQSTNLILIHKLCGYSIYKAFYIFDYLLLYIIEVQ